MAWELRQNGKEYYYSARRVDGKIIKKCHGPGWRGIIAELAVNSAAQRRRANIEERGEFLAELWKLERISQLAKIASQNALYCTFLLAGYERTPCHHWRKTKDSTMNIPTFASLAHQAQSPDIEAEDAPLAEEKTELQTASAKSQFWPAGIDETISLVMSGRRDMLGVLRSQLVDVPELWKKVSDLTRVAIQGWASKIARGRKHVAFRESIVLAATTERAKLLGKCSTIMERAIVDRWTISKLQLSFFEILASSQDEASIFSKTDTAIERRHRSAEHQFREATRQLSKVRTIQQEAAPDGPAANANVGIRLHVPEQTSRKSA